MATKKTTNKKKTEADKAIEAINVPQSGDGINRTITDAKTSELVGFMVGFASTKECQMVSAVLARLMQQPQRFHRDNEFNTLYNVAMLDGERELLDRFFRLINASLMGDRFAIENELTKGPFA